MNSQQAEQEPIKKANTIRCSWDNKQGWAQSRCSRNVWATAMIHATLWTHRPGSPESAGKHKGFRLPLFCVFPMNQFLTWLYFQILQMRLQRSSVGMLGNLKLGKLHVQEKSCRLLREAGRGSRLWRENLHSRCLWSLRALWTCTWLVPQACCLACIGMALGACCSQISSAWLLLSSSPFISFLRSDTLWTLRLYRGISQSANHKHEEHLLRQGSRYS